MDQLKKAYNQLCKDEFSEYKFKTYGHNHYRIINDVFQSFYLHKSVYQESCTVEFTVVPLCISYSLNRSFCQAMHLKMFENKWTWFKYDKNSQESIDACLNEICSYMKKYLMPFFEASKDCEQAYKSICDFENEHISGGMIYVSTEKLWMTLKSKNYKMALLHIRAIKEHTLSAYEDNANSFGEEYRKKNHDRIYALIKRFDELELYILNESTEILDELINENEEKNRQQIHCKRTR